MLITLLSQHFLLGVKFIVSHVIPDVPQWVQDEMARQQYKAQLALRVSSFYLVIQRPSLFLN